MSTFSIEIDATQLVYRDFVIPGKTGWISSRQVQTLALEPGEYNFQIASGYFADFTFLVTSKGAVDYDPKFGAFLSGKGTSKLTIPGLVVTLDARYLSGSGVLLVIPATNEDWITYKTCRMVPASSYSVQQGSGEVTSFSFKIEAGPPSSDGISHGVFVYDEKLYGGFVAGNGTSTLEFLGYPILVDARAAGGAGLTIQPIWGMPFAYTAVQFANLLPAPGFSLQVNSGVVTRAGFLLKPNGEFWFDPSLDPYLEFGTFHGLKLLKVKAPLPT
jgi:hypothetical protein